MTFEVLFHRQNVLLQGLHLGFFVMNTGHHRRERWFPVVDVHFFHSVLPAELATSATDAADAHRVRWIDVLQRLAGHGVFMIQRISNPVPTVLHIGDTASKRFFAGSGGPIVASRDPFIDQLLGPCLEEVDAAIGECQHHTMRSLPVVAGGRKCMS